jgi:hypothetical protein
LRTTPRTTPLSLKGKALDNGRVVQAPADAIAKGWKNVFAIQLNDATGGESKATSNVPWRK